MQTFFHLPHENVFVVHTLWPRAAFENYIHIRGGGTFLAHIKKASPLTLPGEHRKIANVRMVLA